MHAAHDKFKEEAQAAAATSDAELARLSNDLGDAREELALAQAKLVSLADLEAKVLPAPAEPNGAREFYRIQEETMGPMIYLNG